MQLRARSVTRVPLVLRDPQVSTMSVGFRWIDGSGLTGFVRSAWTLTVVGCVLCSQCGAEHTCDLGARACKVAAGRISGGPGDGQVHSEIEPVEQPRHLGIVAGAVNDVTEQLQALHTHRFPASRRFQGRREFSARPHRYGVFPKQDGVKQNGSVLPRLGS